MATPIGHSLAGAAVYAFSGRPVRPPRRDLLVACVILANAPDLDFLPGLLAGDPGRYHQGVTHSLVAAPAAAAIGAAFLAWRGVSLRTGFVLLAFAYVSHLALDFFGGSDSNPPFGVPLLWPFSDVRLASPVPLVMGVRHEVEGSSLNWLLSLFNLFNLVSIALEVALTAPLIWLGVRLRRRRVA
ncbi:MAG: metal-dependent hydrolase [Gemmatimonadota bacterium]